MTPLQESSSDARPGRPAVRPLRLRAARTGLFIVAGGASSAINDSQAVCLARASFSCRVALRNRSRYEPGGTPNVRKKARRIDSRVPNPQSEAMASIASADSSRRRRARSTLAVSTKFPGVIPVSRLKTRAKFRGLIATCAAIASTVSSWSRWSPIQA